ncbi:uncharacterized protein LOC142329244 [Lycorma delicatula]|uniref:uncharacterized protein LOC142329244 n=1 Tax=Lycorma delicatula TaxID=130591 RepID=UPI003F518084
MVGSNVTTDISPVTLSSDWSRVARLLLVVGLAVIGSVGNVYMISAVMIEDYLKRREKDQKKEKGSEKQEGLG